MTLPRDDAAARKMTDAELISCLEFARLTDADATRRKARRSKTRERWIAALETESKRRGLNAPEHGPDAI